MSKMAPPAPPKHYAAGEAAFASQYPGGDAAFASQLIPDGFPADFAELVPRIGGLDRTSNPNVTPIGPALNKAGRPGGRWDFQAPRPNANLLPDQEFIPINTDSPSLDRMQVFGDAPFVSSLFSSPFAMFGPVTSYDGEGSDGRTGPGLMADLHAGSQPVENAAGRHKPEGGNQ